VQSRLLKKNRRVLCVLCEYHSLNSVVPDAAGSSSWLKMLFRFLQRVSRCDISQSCVDITLKPFSDVRWECEIENVKTVRFQIGKVRSALIKERETTEHSLTCCEATLLIENISSYRLLICSGVLHNIIFHINLVSKMMQNKTLSTDSASKLTVSMCKFLLPY
jgi:hypothetical protein